MCRTGSASEHRRAANRSHQRSEKTMKGGEYTFRCMSGGDEWDERISAESEGEALLWLSRRLGAGRRYAVKLVSGPPEGASSAFANNRHEDSQLWLFDEP
jgi:hypothetical protein